MSAKRVAIALAITAVGSLALAIVHPRAPRFSSDSTRQLSVAEALSLTDILWVDARPLARFEAAHIPGAINVSEDAWIDGLERLLIAHRPGQRVVVYCDGAACAASAAVADRIEREAGFTGVHVLQGGWSAWQAQGESR